MKADSFPPDELSRQAGGSPADGAMPLLDEDFPWHRIRRLPRK
ncbi:hypothetical protein ABIC71_001475 [Herbaspirillum seropedicae]